MKKHIFFLKLEYARNGNGIWINKNKTKHIFPSIWSWSWISWHGLEHYCILPRTLHTFIFQNPLFCSVLCGVKATLYLLTRTISSNNTALQLQRLCPVPTQFNLTSSYSYEKWKIYILLSKKWIKCESIREHIKQWQKKMEIMRICNNNSTIRNNKKAYKHNKLSSYDSVLILDSLFFFKSHLIHIKHNIMILA